MTDGARVYGDDHGVLHVVGHLEIWRDGGHSILTTTCGAPMADVDDAREATNADVTTCLTCLVGSVLAEIAARAELIAAAIERAAHPRMFVRAQSRR
jgi:hypothetical protein